MIRAKVLSIENELIQLGFEHGTVLEVPMSAVEGEVRVGQDVGLLAVALGGEDAGRQRMARDLLNELLHPAEQSEEKK